MMQDIGSKAGHHMGIVFKRQMFMHRIIIYIYVVYMYNAYIYQYVDM